MFAIYTKMMSVRFAFLIKIGNTMRHACERSARKSLVEHLMSRCTGTSS